MCGRRRQEGEEKRRRCGADGPTDRGKPLVQEAAQVWRASASDNVLSEVPVPVPASAPAPDPAQLSCSCFSIFIFIIAFWRVSVCHNTLC